MDLYKETQQKSQSPSSETEVCTFTALFIPLNMIFLYNISFFSFLIQTKEQEPKVSGSQEKTGEPEVKDKDGKEKKGKAVEKTTQGKH